MATYTDNYHLSKPETTDSQQSFIEDYATNMEIIDENMGGGSGGGGHVIIDENGTEVAQEPNMQFTGKVEVTDDSTNEKTVVTLPEEVKEVTLAEYNALPDSKLTDGKAYFIKDLDNPSVEGYPPLIYSLEEREVGIWKDGKPLYQKTILANSTDVSGTLQHIDVSALDIDTFVKVDGTFDRITANNVHRIYPFNAYESSSYYGFVRYLVEDKELGFNITMASNQSTTQQVFTIQYTKVADTAGSGTWNGQGGLAHHYSTNETVVGTWIDGKPIYQRTWSGTKNNGQDEAVISDLSNVDVLVDSRVTFIGNTGSQIVQYYRDANDRARIWIEGGDLKVHMDSGNNYPILPMTWYITLQYTKTTD